MDILQRTGLSHKFSDEYWDLIARSVKGAGVEDGDLAWVESEMKNRIVIGNCRYERTPLIDPDQDKVLPVGWFQGFEFYRTPLDVWRSGIRNKKRVLFESKNGDFVPDVLNYCQFLYATTDSPSERLYARWTGKLAIYFLANGRLGFLSGYHETALDQGIHGKAASGSANVRPRR